VTLTDHAHGVSHLTDPADHTAPAQASRYLRVQELAALRDVLFAPRRPIRGLFAGRHASRQRGHCVEFNDYREYTPGDEVGDIDWKVFGRSDRLFIKLFEHQTDMTVGLLIDASASMAYAGLNRPQQGTRRPVSWMERLKSLNNKRIDVHATSPIDNPSKYDQACLMAAAIAFLTVRQQDRVGLAFARRGLHRELEARGGFAQLNHVLRAMETTRLMGDAQLADAVRDLSCRLPRRSLMIVFSDLMEDRDATRHALGEFVALGGEVIVFHVLHEDELCLPDLPEAVFIDSETHRRVRLNVPDIKDAYESRIRESADTWRNELTTRGIDYHPVSTATHYHEAIRDYLFTRAARA
jgi:uncharacterized protein (DUF58 family)